MFGSADAYGQHGAPFAVLLALWLLLVLLAEQLAPSYPDIPSAVCALRNCSLSMLCAMRGFFMQAPRQTPRHACTPTERCADYRGWTRAGMVVVTLDEVLPLALLAQLAFIESSRAGTRRPSRKLSGTMRSRSS